MSTESAMFLAPIPTTDAVPPVIERLVEQHQAAWVDQDSIDDWLAGGGDCVLFIAGDPVRFPECVDVAVVLPELQRVFFNGFRIGVAKREREHEDVLANRFGTQRRPSLVFLRDGAYVSVIAGMRDWDEYVREVQRALAMPTSRPPSIGIPVISAAAGGSCH